MMTITFAWWAIPTIVTVAGLYWAFFVIDDGGGSMSGLTNLLALIPVSVVSSIVWVIFAVWVR